MTSIKKPTLDLLSKSFGNLRSVINIENDKLQIPFITPKMVFNIE